MDNVSTSVVAREAAVWYLGMNLPLSHGSLPFIHPGSFRSVTSMKKTLEVEDSNIF